MMSPFASRSKSVVNEYLQGFVSQRHWRSSRSGAQGRSGLRRRSSRARRRTTPAILARPGAGGASVDGGPAGATCRPFAIARRNPVCRLWGLDQTPRRFNNARLGTTISGRAEVGTLSILLSLSEDSPLPRPPLDSEAAGVRPVAKELLAELV
jgi:hypothetical protein